MYVYVIALRNAKWHLYNKDKSTHPELNRNNTKHFSKNLLFKVVKSMGNVISFRNMQYCNNVGFLCCDVEYFFTKYYSDGNEEWLDDKDAYSNNGVL